MGRAGRVDVGGMVYHVLNRANVRSRLFRGPAHYQEFLSILEESSKFVPLRILAYGLMPNHWHLVLYPRADGDLVKSLQRVTLNHTQRYHAKTRTVESGHVYQGRYKSLLVEKIRYAIQRSRPYGSDKWVSNAVGKFGLKITMRNPGRPKKGS